MKFEEQFPSLKDKSVFTEELSYIRLTKGSVKIYLEDTIKNECLDKQKVKEALIDLCACKWATYNDDQPPLCPACKKIKELGL